MSSSYRSSSHKDMDKLEEILDAKIGDEVGIITTGGSVTFGTVAGVDDDVLTLATTFSFVAGLPFFEIFAPVSFIPLAQIATILDDVDVPQVKSQAELQLKKE